MQEKEFFAERNPEIANPPNAARRKEMIANLATTNPALLEEFCKAKRQADGESHLVRNSDRYPLCGRGDINTYAIFAELKRNLINSMGRVGCIVPSGIATDDTTQLFFQDLMGARSLASLYDFENSKGIFCDVHRSYKFCLLTLTGRRKAVEKGADFIFCARDTNDILEENRHFSLTGDDSALLNPNTRTCPIFRSRHDMELTRFIYRRIPVLIKDGSADGNPWGISYLRMFDMTNDSHLFRTREQLEADSWPLDGNAFRRADDIYLPLYEGKMIWQSDHRAASVDYRGGWYKEDMMSYQLMIAN